MGDNENQLENAQESMTDAPQEGQSPENEATPIDVGGQGEAIASEEVAPEVPVQEAQGGAVQAQVEELMKQIDSLKAQVEERTNQYMRIAADFDNFRRRTQKEKEDLEQQIKCSTVVELLPVVDNFERARSQIKPQTDPEMNIHKSYQGVYKDLVDRLKRIGVSPMRAEGKEFDPALHEAVLREATHEYPEGTVMEELVRGYLLGERVLRHAMVKVAAVPDSDDLGADQQGDSND